MQMYTVNRGGIGRVVCMTFFGAISFLGAVSRDVKEVGHSGEQKKKTNTDFFSWKQCSKNLPLASDSASTNTVVPVYGRV